MPTDPKDVIYDLLLASDGEDARGHYAHEGGVTGGDGDEATAVILNMETRERYRLTARSVPSDSTSQWVVVRYNGYPETGDITVYGPFSSQADAEAHGAKVGSAQVEPLEQPLSDLSQLNPT